MMKQSYTSFLNIVHQKANIHIFVIKVNKSTSQQVNESTGQRVEVRWVWLGRKGRKGL